MEQQIDRSYEINAHAFYYLSNTVTREYWFPVIEEILKKLDARFGSLSKEESEDLRRLLRSFGEEVERLAGVQRRVFDGRWLAYQRGYKDGNKSV